LLRVSTPLLVHTQSREETQALGAALAVCVRPGQVIALRGDLGAGKTAFVQGLAAGLGVQARVTSPTFILVNEYLTPAGSRLIHVDTYRLGDTVDVASLEAATFGLEETLSSDDAVVAIEWAERVADVLPSDHILVEFTHSTDRADGRGERTLRLSARGPASAAALDRLAIALASEDV